MWRMPESRHRILLPDRPTVRAVITGAKPSISENMPGSLCPFFKALTAADGNRTADGASASADLVFPQQQRAFPFYRRGRLVGEAKLNAGVGPEKARHRAKVERAGIERCRAGFGFGTPYECCRHRSGRCAACTGSASISVGRRASLVCRSDSRRVSYGIFPLRERHGRRR